ncbi:hypothetical protein [Aeromicrobium chenweiae]|uniref:Uncharacterized protein n=1 Tax=Aeromicrobium chenweiae TaxID=2079793 RepID=A0A2S0WLY8_9ACTN|nr:hypothetical protein [Aeromicrobium chenweiae]AWB92284.1 hypothetical protein C3E78_08770 [Aeromicrobium chenweiae]TGN31432.1 hypothetical protein E4L97_13800 [Aeromicrobium chenweiae]
MTDRFPASVGDPHLQQVDSLCRAALEDDARTLRRTGVLLGVLAAGALALLLAGALRDDATDAALGAIGVAVLVPVLLLGPARAAALRRRPTPRRVEGGVLLVENRAHLMVFGLAFMVGGLVPLVLSLTMSDLRWRFIPMLVGIGALATGLWIVVQARRRLTVTLTPEAVLVRPLGLRLPWSELRIGLPSPTWPRLDVQRLGILLRDPEPIPLIATTHLALGLWETYAVLLHYRDHPERRRELGEPDALAAIDRITRRDPSRPAPRPGWFGPPLG